MKKLLGIFVLGLLWCNLAYSDDWKTKVESLGWKSKKVDLNFSCKASSSPADFKDNLNLSEELSIAISKVLKKLDEKYKVRNFGFKKYTYKGKEMLIVLDKSLGEEKYSKPYGAIDHLGETREVLDAYRWFDIIDFNNDKVLLVRELTEFYSGEIELIEFWAKTNEDLYEQFNYTLKNQYTNEKSEEVLFAFLIVLQEVLRNHIDLDKEELKERFNYKKPTQYLGNVFEKTDWPNYNEFSSYITFKFVKN